MCCGCEGYMIRMLYGAGAALIGGTYLISHMAEGPKKTAISIAFYTMPFLLFCFLEHSRTQKKTKVQDC